MKLKVPVYIWAAGFIAILGAILVVLAPKKNILLDMNPGELRAFLERKLEAFSHLTFTFDQFEQKAPNEFFADRLVVSTAAGKLCLLQGLHLHFGDGGKRGVVVRELQINEASCSSEIADHFKADAGRLLEALSLREIFFLSDFYIEKLKVLSLSLFVETKGGVASYVDSIPFSKELFELAELPPRDYIAGAIFYNFGLTASAKISPLDQNISLKLNDNEDSYAYILPKGEGSPWKQYLAGGLNIEKAIAMPLDVETSLAVEAPDFELYASLLRVRVDANGLAVMIRLDESRMVRESFVAKHVSMAFLGLNKRLHLKCQDLDLRESSKSCSDLRGFGKDFDDAWEAQIDTELFELLTSETGKLTFEGLKLEGKVGETAFELASSFSADFKKSQGEYIFSSKAITNLTNDHPQSQSFTAEAGGSWDGQQLKIDDFQLSSFDAQWTIGLSGFHNFATKAYAHEVKGDFQHKEILNPIKAIFADLSDVQLPSVDSFHIQASASRVPKVGSRMDATWQLQDASLPIGAWKTQGLQLEGSVHIESEQEDLWQGALLRKNDVIALLSTKASIAAGLKLNTAELMAVEQGIEIGAKQLQFETQVTWPQGDARPIVSGKLKIPSLFRRSEGIPNRQVKIDQQFDWALHVEEKLELDLMGYKFRSDSIVPAEVDTAVSVSSKGEDLDLVYQARGLPIAAIETLTGSELLVKGSALDVSGRMRMSQFFHKAPQMAYLPDLPYSGRVQGDFSVIAQHLDSKAVSPKMKIEGLTFEGKHRGDLGNHRFLIDVHADHMSLEDGQQRLRFSDPTHQFSVRASTLLSGPVFKWVGKGKIPRLDLEQSAKEWVMQAKWNNIASQLGSDSLQKHWDRETFYDLAHQFNWTVEEQTFGGVFSASLNGKEVLRVESSDNDGLNDRLKVQWTELFGSISSFAMLGKKAKSASGGGVVFFNPKDEVSFDGRVAFSYDTLQAEAWEAQNLDAVIPFSLQFDRKGWVVHQSQRFDISTNPGVGELRAGRLTMNPHLPTEMTLENLELEAELIGGRLFLDGQGDLSFDAIKERGTKVFATLPTQAKHSMLSFYLEANERFQWTGVLYDYFPELGQGAGAYEPGGQSLTYLGAVGAKMLKGDLAEGLLSYLDQPTLGTPKPRKWYPPHLIRLETIFRRPYEKEKYRMKMTH